MGLFLNYFSGARGDFLINCLVDHSDSINFLENYIKAPANISTSAKMHSDVSKGLHTQIPNFKKSINTWHDLFDEVNKHNLVKIKIITSTLTERIDAMWFFYVKCKIDGRDSKLYITPDKVLDTREIIKKFGIDIIPYGVVYDIPHAENLDKNFQHEYDYIVNFADLFDIDYIKDLYVKINEKHMPYDKERAIIKNISMQQRLSETEYFLLVEKKCQDLMSNNNDYNIE